MEQKKSKVGVAVVAGIVVLIGIGAAVYALTMPQSSKESTSSGDSNNSSSTGDTSTAGSSSDDPDTPVSSDVSSNETIVFTNDGFSKSSYKVTAGSVVTVRNDSSMSVQFSSADHPTHLEEPALNMSTLSAGQSGTFTAPDEPGEYGFHDHINDQFTGTLIVE